MHGFSFPSDTICAIATAPGEAAIGVIRLSGPGAIAAVDRAVRLQSKQPLKSLEDRRVAMAQIIDESHSGIIDEVLVTVMRGPRSYTREDVVELSCHGGPHVLKRVVELLLAPGVRLAQPGEFTRRAFLNGRIDLAQAEAVMDLIRAQSDAGARSAVAQLRGGLSAEIRTLQERLLGVLVEIEASIDFSEEGLEFLPREALTASVDEALGEIRRLLATADQGRIVREGASVVIAGRPNVGKSSLLNVLLRENRAIVTPIPGTTRDTIEESANLGGISVRLSDTAGVRQTHDPVEVEGIRRTKDAIADADLVIAVFDGSEPLAEDDRALLGDLKGRSVIAVLNKADLPQRLTPATITGVLSGAAVFQVSTLTRQGIEELTKEIVSRLHGGGGAKEGAFVTRLRHVEALKRADASLVHLKVTLAECGPHECVALDLRGAVDALGEILGTMTTDDVLNEIFSRFCIGK
ncbi:MAG TPA: tRNA uridine-5-carboxymethylaminomethyl(34) synthesis GTPase MnmE [Nitrospiria bacterium]|nr:tRNA uridine-5-carboxymethylaminomethyl(34) synthesis GTPase MnmE [Nitrospiria bacterium]